jgi:hypothetical protein
VATQNPAPPRSLRLLAQSFVVCRFAADAPAPLGPGHTALWSLTRTADELSLVCEEALVPAGAEGLERGWRAIQVEGPIPFDETGVIAGLTVPLAAAGIPVFAISTFDTDYLLVRDADVNRAIAALERSRVAGARGTRVR